MVVHTQRRNLRKVKTKYFINVLQAPYRRIRLYPSPSRPREKDGRGLPARRGRAGAPGAGGGADELDKHLEWIENTDNGAAIEERRNEMFPFLRLLIHLFRSTTFNPHSLSLTAAPMQ